MPIAHTPKAGALLTGTEYEADPHTIPTLAEVLAAGNDVGGQVIQGADVSDDGPWGAYLFLNPASGTAAGAALLAAGDGMVAHAGGDVQVAAGYGDDANISPGSLNLTAGGGDGTGGSASLVGGDSGSGSGKQGGDITLTSGAGDGAGRNGLIFLNLPTADPHVAGALYSNAGVVMVSAG